MARFLVPGYPAVLAASVALVLACTTEATGPASLAVVSGEGQTGISGALMADSLVVIVTGSNGSAFAGATVDWAVTAGAASVSPTSSVSDAAGRAAAAVTLGGAIGAVTVSATVAGVAPLLFHLSAVNACDWRAPSAFPATLAGTLHSSDCGLADGSFVDFYQFTVLAQQAVRIRLVSTAFDAFLLLADANDQPLAANDDDATSLNSELLVILAAGSYVAGANSYLAGATGAYTLTTAAIAENVSGCATWYVTPAITTSQVLAATDCASGGFYADGMFVALRGGWTYTIAQNSAAFDAFLILADAAGNTLATNDDGGGGNDARIVYAVPTTGLYIVLAASFLAGEVGPYTLSLSAPTAAGGARKGDPSVAPVRQWRQTLRIAQSASLLRPAKPRD